MLPRTFYVPLCRHGLTSLWVTWHCSAQSTEELPGVQPEAAASYVCCSLLQFLPFAILAVCMSSRQEHSEWLLPGRPGHGLVAGEFTSPLSTGPLHPWVTSLCLFQGPCLRPAQWDRPVGCVGTNCSKFCKGLWSLKTLFLSLWVSQLAPLSLGSSCVKRECPPLPLGLPGWRRYFWVRWG